MGRAARRCSGHASMAIIQRIIIISFSYSSIFACHFFTGAAFYPSGVVWASELCLHHRLVPTGSPSSVRWLPLPLLPLHEARSAKPTSKRLDETVLPEMAEERPRSASGRIGHPLIVPGDALDMTDDGGAARRQPSGTILPSEFRRSASQSLSIPTLGFQAEGQPVEISREECVVSGNFG